MHENKQCTVRIGANEVWHVREIKRCDCFIGDISVGDLSRTHDICYTWDIRMYSGKQGLIFEVQMKIILSLKSKLI